jgi:hypothetical protein
MKKHDVLTAGTNITIDANNVISSTGGGGDVLTAGTGITLVANVISAGSSFTGFKLCSTICGLAVEHWSRSLESPLRAAVCKPTTLFETSHVAVAFSSTTC